MKQNIVEENRIGNFEISVQIIKDADESLLKFFGNFIIIRAESMFYGGRIEYTGYSKLFDKNSVACIPPKYLIHVHKEETEGGFSFSFSAEKRG